LELHDRGIILDRELEGAQTFRRYAPVRSTVAVVVIGDVTGVLEIFQNNVDSERAAASRDGGHGGRQSNIALAAGLRTGA
jgi:hypothetical protein